MPLRAAKASKELHMRKKFGKFEFFMKTLTDNKE